MLSYISPLVQFSLANVRKKDGDLLESGRLELIEGDG